MLISLIALAPALLVAPRDFYDYLAKKDGAYRSEVTRSATETRIELTSQVWQGIPWKHTILLRQPKTLPKKGVAILYITGDGPRPGDLVEVPMIVGATGFPVAALFNVPNQPIWDLKEDDLIAHTFEKYLETNDPSWPLLFPMAKSAIKAMDAVQAATRYSENPITKFVVAGASKRGWTTWFVGASKDPRILGIAPLVIDNLNIPKQMPHQLANWGKYSEQIEEYTRRGLQAKLETKKGQELTRMIDPYYYLDAIKVPVMIVNGANDPYWSVDSLSLYWNDLPMPHWASIIPNAGHDMGTKVQAIEVVGAFAHSLAGEFEMPKLDWKLTELRAPNETHRTLLLQAVSKKHPIWQMRALTAVADNLDFRPVKWETAAEVKIDPVPTSVGSSPAIKFLIPRGKNVAVLAEARFKIGSRVFTLSRPVTVFKK
ncbi:MAG: PhoPQ-activated protein PqaA family protein [Fimbriimonas sp.]